MMMMLATLSSKRMLIILTRSGRRFGCTRLGYFDLIARTSEVRKERAFLMNDVEADDVDDDGLRS